MQSTQPASIKTAVNELADKTKATPHITSEIKGVIEKEAKIQVDKQIEKHIAIPLTKQKEETDERLSEVQVSLTNSKARIANAAITLEHMNDKLEPLLKKDGERSKVYPADLTSLFAYDLKMVRELLHDYGLESDTDLRVNLNRFLDYIGSLICTVESPLNTVHQAYRRLTHPELVLFLKLRNLPTSGSDDELASRLTNHDFHLYHFPNASGTISSSPSSASLLFPHPPKRHRTSGIPDLPVEILADIMDHVGDWELSRAVGVPTSIPRPLEWSRASCTDHAMITGSLPLIRAVDPTVNPPTKIGADLAVRFGYVHVLEFFLSHHHGIFLSIFKGDLIPVKASRHGRINILSWWKHGFEHHPDLVPPPKPGSIADAIDGASRNGQIASLDWWMHCGHHMEYTEAALEYASSKNQIAVLQWWKEQHERHKLPLKIGRVMDMASTAGHVEVLEWWATSQLDPKYDRHALQHASCHGKVEVLEWWLGSGLPLIFDQDALTGATRHNRPEVLEWWNKSGLPIQYRMCDIEEALEDAIGGGENARQWWKHKGVDFNANDKEWMKLQNLNS
ncbi:hypothetical protein EV421DRAFT_1887213 [Armillaria borealis]|uniref:Uncharacterized protein n=1 Tax=Armillaria borealis TaxID=47425 RepID=A0AA39K5B5_9AGAR|nr:hypothetical protein EV421DRAFT_1887213 [Armillaria borealis]